MDTRSVARRHAAAIQLSVGAALVTAAMVALPLLAQPTGYGDYIVKRFQKTGAESGAGFDNRFVETNAFDFAAYFSHTCFRPTEYDRAGCEREFGPEYWNLYETLASGKLKEILASYKHLNGAEKAVTPKPVTKANDVTADSKSWTEATPKDDGMYQKTRDARAKTLWATCQKQSNDRADAGRCYRRNVRLLNQESWDLDVASNVY